MVGHKSLSGADVRSEEIIVTKRVWHPRGTLPSASVPDENAPCARLAREDRFIGATPGVGS